MVLSRILVFIALLLSIGCKTDKGKTIKREFHPNDTLKRKYTLNSNGLITGSDSLFALNGSLKKVTFWDDGKLVDSIIKYDTFFEEIALIGRIKGDKLTYYDVENGRKTSEVKLKDGLKSGLRVYYNTEGKIRGFLGYKKNKRNGFYIRLDENKLPDILMQFNKNYNNQILSKFHNNGRLKYFRAYDSLSNGYSLSFYTNGSLRDISEIKNGTRDGFTYLFSEDGKFIEKKFIEPNF